MFLALLVLSVDPRHRVILFGALMIHVQMKPVQFELRSGGMILAVVCRYVSRQAVAVSGNSDESNEH